MSRWKIIDSKRGEEFGIKELEIDPEGLIVLDVLSIPPGMSLERYLEYIEEKGVLLKIG